MVDRDLKEKVEGTLHPDFAIGGGKKRRQTLQGLVFPSHLMWQSGRAAERQSGRAAERQSSRAAECSREILFYNKKLFGQL